MSDLKVCLERTVFRAMDTFIGNLTEAGIAVDHPTLLKLTTEAKNVTKALINVL